MSKIDVYVDELEGTKLIRLGGDIDPNELIDIKKSNKKKIVTFEIKTPGYEFTYGPKFPEGPIGLHPAIDDTKPPKSSKFWQWYLQLDSHTRTKFSMRYPKGPLQARVDWFVIRVIGASDRDPIELDPKIRNGFPDSFVSESKAVLIVGAIGLALVSFALGFNFAGP